MTDADYPVRELHVYTAEEILGVLPTSAIEQVNVWLARGDGIAVYEASALDRSDLGTKKFVSYGSPAAQLEVTPPPNRLPDIGNEINWAYVLLGVYRGELL